MIAAAPTLRGMHRPWLRDLDQPGW